MKNDRLARYRGALLGLAVGDALGAQVEFMSRDSYPLVVDMVGGGPHNLKPGQWTDDTSMALCLAESLIDNDGKFVASSLMGKWLKWWQEGYLSSTGWCFDIGKTTATALCGYASTGSVCAPNDAHSAGNESLVRLAPAAMVHADLCEVMFAARSSSRLTHGNPDCVLACELFATYLWRALRCDGDKCAVLAPPRVGIDDSSPLMAVACGCYRTMIRDEVESTGDVVHTLEAALWAFWHGNDFASTVLLAANLGEDADSVAAVAGQLAGAFYGVNSIPVNWLGLLAKKNKIQAMADRLYEIAKV